MKKWQEYSVTFGGIVLLFILFEVLMAQGIINNYVSGVLVLIGINIIAAASLNLATGYLGQLALGHAGFMAIGAYSAAFVMKVAKINGFQNSDGIVVGLMIVALIFAGVMAAIFGILIGIPALRLRGDYLGIVTLGFGEIIRIAIFNLDFKVMGFQFTGGARGFRGYLGYMSFEMIFWLVIIVLAILYLIIRSRHGRAILSIREDEIAAEAVGVPTTFYKIFGFATSAFFAGIAGGCLAFYQKMIDPKKFTFMYSVEIFIIVVLGGMGSLTGTIVAAIILGILNEFLHVIDQWRLVIYSALLIIMMIFRPEGLLGSKEFSLVGLIKKVMGKKSSSKSSDAQEVK
ncbi:branched-chain amino acid ABC transporter permease [Sporanaerobium hydrogeniformans]|uniref:Branched-chain amino acid ABC transporter permease n=1 Tax=Sporanaerobium hydrogeniformans TaxID=3072179 RepID=A0AC61DFF7_9FIRM|nr:branched-chain amino acid ABC transporter permease [Sporanaerobium hydrogeniformans]PHV71999.1 branched-chain amino acid ABC transporter permease [Sporanaerobium hydrogeniformans]